MSRFYYHLIVWVLLFCSPGYAGIKEKLWPALSTRNPFLFYYYLGQNTFNLSNEDYKRLLMDTLSDDLDYCFYDFVFQHMKESMPDLHSQVEKYIKDGIITPEGFQLIIQEKDKNREFHSPYEFVIVENEDKSINDLIKEKIQTLHAEKRSAGIFTNYTKGGRHWSLIHFRFLEKEENPECDILLFDAVNSPSAHYLGKYLRMNMLEVAPGCSFTDTSLTVDLHETPRRQTGFKECSIFAICDFIESSKFKESKEMLKETCNLNLFHPELMKTAQSMAAIEDYYRKAANVYSKEEIDKLKREIGQSTIEIQNSPKNSKDELFAEFVRQRWTKPQAPKSYNEESNFYREVVDGCKLSAPHHPFYPIGEPKKINVSTKRQFRSAIEFLLNKVIH
jgi:hypothetical protein